MQEIISAIIALGGASLIIVAFALFMHSYEGNVRKRIEGGEEDAALRQKSEVAKKKSRAFKVLGTALFWIIIALFVPFVALSVLTKINGGRLVAPSGIMAVATGSMGEVNPVNASSAEKWSLKGFGQYSLIVLERAESPEDISLYDIIAYVNGDGLTIIHRVVAIEGDGDGVRYTTRGDANGADDKYRPSFSDIIGRYNGVHVERIGIAVLFMQSYSGMITAAALVIMLIIADGSLRRTEGYRRARARSLAVGDSTECGRQKENVTENGNDG